MTNPDETGTTGDLPLEDAIEQARTAAASGIPVEPRVASRILEELERVRAEIARLRVENEKMLERLRNLPH